MVSCQADARLRSVHLLRRTRGRLVRLRGGAMVESAAENNACAIVPLYPNELTPARAAPHDASAESAAAAAPPAPSRSRTSGLSTRSCVLPAEQAVEHLSHLASSPPDPTPPPRARHSPSLRPPPAATRVHGAVYRRKRARLRWVAQRSARAVRLHARHRPQAPGSHGPTPPAAACAAPSRWAPSGSRPTVLPHRAAAQRNARRAVLHSAQHQRAHALAAHVPVGSTSNVLHRPSTDSMPAAAPPASDAAPA